MIGKRRADFSVYYAAGATDHKVQDGFPATEHDERLGDSEAQDGDLCGYDAWYYRDGDPPRTYTHKKSLDSFFVRLRYR
jgi:hypothetical protein